MAIRFPRVHIATSVKNRILNLADEIEPATVVAPNVPEPSQAGQMLDAQLAAPLPEMAAPTDASAVATMGSAVDGSSADALLLQGTLDALS